MKKNTILFIFTLIFFFSITMDNVHADSIEYDVNEVIENMKSVNSSQEDIANVLKKLENGEILDSEKKLNEISLQLDEQQLNASKYGLLNTNLMNEEFKEIIRYDDGSFQELSLSVENIQTGGISILSNGGSLTFTPKLRNPVITASFKANIFIPNDNRSSYSINSLSNKILDSRGGTYSNEKLSIVRKTEVQRGSNPAIGRLRWDFTAVADALKSSQYLTIEAGHHIGGRYGIKVTSKPFGLVTY